MCSYVCIVCVSERAGLCILCLRAVGFGSPGRCMWLPLCVTECWWVGFVNFLVTRLGVLHSGVHITASVSLPALAGRAAAASGGTGNHRRAEGGSNRCQCGGCSAAGPAVGHYPRMPNSPFLFKKINILFRIFINGKYYASNSFGWVFFPPGRSGRIPIMVRSEVSYVCLLLATASIAQCSCCSFVFVVPQKLLPLSPERVIQRTHWFYLEVVSQQDRVQSPETGWRQGLRSKCTEAENRAKVGIHPCSHYCTNYPPLLNKTPL